MTGFLFADEDDPDAPALADKGGLTWIKLAQDAANYDFFMSSTTGFWELSHDGGTVSSGSLSTADKVVIRRWRSSPPLPPTLSSAGEASVKKFAERQWEASLMAGLHMSYLHRPFAWSRDPTHQDFKIVSMLLIKDLVAVPPFEIASLPRNLRRQLVAKSVHADQSFEGGRVSTLPVEGSDLRTKQPLPMVFQERIQVTEEWRLGYCFGRVGIVQQVFPAGEVLDHRYAAPASRASVACHKTEADAREISRVLGLNMFTADLLINEQGDKYWCDINPDGLYAAADAPEAPLQTALIEGVR